MNDLSGHRQRLKKRFLEGGRQAVADYELLELILFSAVPRGDVKPLAKMLLQTFGNFRAVIAAEPEALGKIKGVGESVIAALKVIEASVHEMCRIQILDQPILSSWQHILDYCRVVMGTSVREEFRLLFVNNQNALIGEERHQRGTVDQTPVYPREVVKRALELNATAIILVHNHPSGDAHPSKADIVMTKEIVRACEAVDIHVHDHLIVTQNDHTSFKALGLI
jgi:DNA repair protein RadC